MLGPKFLPATRLKISVTMLVGPVNLQINTVFLKHIALLITDTIADGDDRVLVVETAGLLNVECNIGGHVKIEIVWIVIRFYK